MQVYQVNTGGFLCWNKYHGRALTVEGFQGALCQFLDNGRVFRLELVDGILTRLKRLRSALESLETFRFYCSSLLIIYEGAKYPVSKVVKSGAWKERDDQTCNDSAEIVPAEPTDESVENNEETSKTEETAEHKIQVKLIDFAHATCKGFEDSDQLHDGPDRGLIFGLDNLISIFESIVNQHGCKP